MRNTNGSARLHAGARTSPTSPGAATRRIGPLAIVAAAALISFAGKAAAEDTDDIAGFYRNKTISVVVGFAPGGGYDSYARLLARHFGKFVPGNPSVVVQNLPGSGSLKAVKMLDAKADADVSAHAATAQAAIVFQRAPRRAQTLLVMASSCELRRYCWLCERRRSAP